MWLDRENDCYYQITLWLDMAVYLNRVAKVENVREKQDNSR